MEFSFDWNESEKDPDIDTAEYDDFKFEIHYNIHSNEYLVYYEVGLLYQHIADFKTKDEAKIGAKDFYFKHLRNEI